MCVCANVHIMESQVGNAPIEMAKAGRESLEARCICQSLSEQDLNVDAQECAPISDSLVKARLERSKICHGVIICKASVF